MAESIRQARALFQGDQQLSRRSRVSPSRLSYKLTVSYPRPWYLSKARELYRENGEGEKATQLGGAFVPRSKSHGKLADLCDWHTFAAVSEREREREERRK